MQRGSVTSRRTGASWSLHDWKGGLAPKCDLSTLISLSCHGATSTLFERSCLLFPSISPPALSQPALTPSPSVLRPMPSVVTSVGIGSGLTLLPGRSRQAGRGRLAPNTTHAFIIAGGGGQNRGVRFQSRDRGGRQHPHKQEGDSGGSGGGGGGGGCGGSWGGRKHHDGEG